MLHHLRRLIAAAVLAALPGFGLAAQQSTTVTGRVTSAGAPLGGAQVGIVELGVGSVTDAQGRFTFTVDPARAGGKQVTVLARTIGYRPVKHLVTLTAGRLEQNFDLEKDVLNLEAIVTTGVSDATSQKKTTFAVAAVNNAQIKEAPASSPLGALSGRVAGASVTAVNGEPGSAPRIRLRGPTSLTGSQDPLIIVDGTISRLSLADINAQDIERIEVIKGAAASSLYGSDAANGVVQIFTKRGASLATGQTQIIVRNELGSNDLRKTIPNNFSHPYKLDASGKFLRDANGNRIQEDDRISDNSYPVVYDQLGDVFRSGQFMTNYISIGQRNANSNFNASFENARDQGIANLLSGYSRQNFRLNLDMELHPKLDFQTGAFYGQSRADQADDSSGDAFFGLRFLEPNINLNDKNPNGTPYLAAIRQSPASGNVSNPLYNWSNIQNSNDRARFTGLLKVRYRPATWLTAEANTNFDRGSGTFRSLVPLGYIGSTGTVSKGSLSNRENVTRAYNLGTTLTAVKSTSWFTNTTRLAWVYEDQENQQTTVRATALTVPRVTEFSAASRDPENPVIPGSFSQPIRNQNFFAITTFDIKDKYIIDGLIRQDQSSLFGEDQRSRLFKRLSGAWRVSEDLSLPGVNEFKLRASYGEAGLRPVFDAQYEQFAIEGGSPVKITLGNPNLRPAFSREIEGGFDLTFAKNFQLQYSYSSKITDDQILNVPVSSATGFRNQWLNAGSLEGKTHEVLLSAVIASRKDFVWTVNVAGDRTRQTVRSLAVPPFLVGPVANTTIFRLAPGQPFGIVYGSSWVQSQTQLDAMIASKRLTGTAADYVLNEEGYYVAKNAWRTLNERPIKFLDADGNALRQIADVNPDFNLNFNTQLNWKQFSVTAVVNWVQGGQIYNYTRQWPFFDQRDPAFDQRDKPEVEKKPTTYYATFYNNFDANTYFVEDGSYVRLRELAVNYQVPKAITRRFGMSADRSARFGIVGRNLFTSTKYSGYDPDVSGGGANPFAYRVDYFTYPIFKTFTFMLELGL
ncbi:SusC/RagA family TonB-linked outer membrane protein [Gemmatimonas sp.]|jgi:TonB-linked SusC/RagA family outer membrane protein|uniref:SusC/RagA family TonB-linked outer membrane protein n=1 Tax=Gemmatimonas sp. TaxID=1962908 RepID=UPI0037C058F6